MGISAAVGQGLGSKCSALVFTWNGETDVFVPSTSAKYIFFYSVCTEPKVAFNRVIKLSPAEIRGATRREG